MSIKRIINNYPVQVGIVIGIAIIVLLICTIVYIPGEAEIVLAVGAICCILVPLIIMIGDHFKGLKSQRGQRISNKRSLAN